MVMLISGVPGDAAKQRGAACVVFCGMWGTEKEVHESEIRNSPNMYSPR